MKNSTVPENYFLVLSIHVYVNWNVWLHDCCHVYNLLKCVGSEL